jgi:membrane protease YdiL (CAAX protease family)
VNIKEDPMSRMPSSSYFSGHTSVSSFKWIGWLFFAYIASVLLGGLLAPIILKCVQHFAAAHPSSSMLEYLSQKRLDVYIDRIKLIGMLVFLPILLKKTRLLSVKSLGLSFPKEGLFIATWFCMMAVLAVSSIAVIQIFLDITLLKPDAELFSLSRFLKTGSSALTVGMLEELIFRAIVLQIFLAAMSPRWAILLSAAFYAYVHFKIPGYMWADLPQETTLIGGITVAFRMLLNPIYYFEPIPFFNLFLIGMILGDLFLHTRSLWPCIGLHAGFVWAIFYYKNTYMLLASHIQWFFGSPRGTDGILASIILLELWFMCRFALRKPKQYDLAGKNSL